MNTHLPGTYGHIHLSQHLYLGNRKIQGPGRAICLQDSVVRRLLGRLVPALALADPRPHPPAATLGCIFSCALQRVQLLVRVEASAGDRGAVTRGEQQRIEVLVRLVALLDEQIGERSAGAARGPEVEILARAGCAVAIAWRERVTLPPGSSTSGANWQQAIRTLIRACIQAQESSRLALSLEVEVVERQRDGRVRDDQGVDDRAGDVDKRERLGGEQQDQHAK